MRRALLGSSALVPAAAASLMFAPSAEAVTLDRDYYRELVEFGRLLYHAVDAVEWELDPETEALKVVFDDGWRGVFEVGEYIVDGDEVFLWPENIYIQAFPVHAVWNILWGHPAGVMAGGGIWWLLGRNSPPVAVDDFLAFTEGQNQGDNEETLFFNVLGDDYDPNSDVISLQPFDDVEGTFGRFTMNAAGTDIQYHFLDDINATNLAEGETATDTATYSIIDEHGLTDTATLTVTITGINKAVEDDDEPSNDPAQGDVSEDANSVNLTNLLDNASDADGGDPFISAVVGGVVGQRVDVAAGGYFIINADGTATYHPDGDFEGLDKGDTTEVSIQYTVSDGRGSTNSSEVTVTVVGENDGFTDADESKSVNENDAGQSIGNILSVTNDPDEADSHSITDVGDSGGLTFSPTEGGKLTVTANGAATFDPEGDFDDLAAGESEEVKITYTVSDSIANGSDRETDTSTLTLTVQGRNDTFTDGNETLTVSEDAISAGSINILGTAGSISDDPDTNDTHTIKTFNGQTVPTTGLTLTSPAISGGTLTVQQNGTVSFNPGDDFDELLSADGTLTFSYVVSDNAATATHTDTSTLTIKITAENDAIVDGDESHTRISALKTQENTSISSGVNVLDNVSDVDDGDTKHVSDSGTKLSGSKTYAGDNGGSFTLTADGAMSFDPGTDFDKLAKDATTETKFEYEVTDGDTTDTSTVTVQITGVNDNPVPVADTLDFTEDSTTTEQSFNAVGNDTDIDGGTIVLSDFTTVTKTYGTFAETASGDDIQYTLDNSLTAVQALAKGQTVSDTAAYTITDGQGGSATTGKVTAKITGVNDAPKGQDFTHSFTEGGGSSSQTFNAMGLASDVDSDVTDTNKNDKLTISLGSTATTHGSFALTADEHQITYTFDDDDSLDNLDTGAKTTETIKYTVKDQHGATAEHTITVTINGLTDNEPPKFTSASSSTVAENSNTPYTLVASDDQTAESALSYEMLSGDDAALFDFDASTRKLTFKSAPNFEEPQGGDTDNEHTVKFKVTDANGATATKTHTVKVTNVNETPVAVADTVTVKESEGEDGTGNNGNLLTNDTDVDAGDGKTVSALSLSDNSTPTVGGWTDLPEGGRIKINADGTYDFDADGDFETLGPYDSSDNTTYETIEVGYTVKDTDGLTATSKLTITVQGENDAPTVVTKANDVAIQHGETAPTNLTFWVPNANDDGYTGTDNGIALTFGDIDGEITALTVAPATEAGLTIADDLSTITGTAALVDHLTAETHTVTVTATDNDGGTVTETLDVYIGLNASEGLEGNRSYTFTGSNVADDEIDAREVGNFGRGGTLDIDLGDGSNTLLTHFQRSVPDVGSSLNYTGGDGEDYLLVRAYAVSKGISKIDAGDGNNTLIFGDHAASHDGSLEYTGGKGEDVISGRRQAGYDGELKFDLGDDDASDTVSFQGEVGADGTGTSADIKGVVEIYNFDPDDEDQIEFGPYGPIQYTRYTPLEAADLSLSLDAQGNIIVKTIGSLTGNKPAVNFKIVGDYSSIDDFTWSTNADDNLVLS